jgi:N-acetylglucosaminyl-diphospho-decaprenol L-rhamnosyltransferase
MRKARVTAILVTYNSSHCVARALASLPADVISVVVDNGSTDDSVTIAEQHADRVVRLKDNLGFSKGCNVGAAIADTEFLLMMNPDSEVEGDAISALIAAAGRHPEAAAFNPQLVRSNAELPASPPQPDDRVVDTLSGAALFVTKQQFDEVGGFDEHFFLYFEDADLSKRLAAKGSLIQVRGACFIHGIGQSSRLTLGDEFRKYRHYGRSRVYYSTKHNQRFNRLREVTAQGLKAIHRLVIGRTRLAAQHLGRAVGYAQGPRQSS